MHAHTGFTTVGIIGAGLMGRGIAQIVAQAGFQVRLFDAAPGAAASAKKAIADTLAMLVTRGKIAATDAQATAARITLCEELSAVGGADLVIEAIIERLDAKQALLKMLEPIVGDDCVLATNTSSLSVTGLAAACDRPQRVAGLHFFSPVPLMKLVEVIDGLRTAPEVTTRLMAFASALGHRPVRARDTPGFIVNHAGRGYGTEALRIVGEGITDYATIDRILRLAAGFRMGPFELYDLVGLDVSHPVMESIYHQFYEEPRFRPSTLTAQRVAGGVLGRKSGRGFYDYSAGLPVPVAEPLPANAAIKRVWVSAKEADVRPRVTDLATRLGGDIDEGEMPSHDSLCIVMPLGQDATTAALEQHLDPRRTVALDTLLHTVTHRTLMVTPITHPEWRDAARALFGADGVPVDIIRDSCGFVTQRVLAHIVNIACDIAQQRAVASPQDHRPAGRQDRTRLSGRSARMGRRHRAGAAVDRAQRDVERVRRPALPGEPVAVTKGPPRAFPCSPTKHEARRVPWRCPCRRPRCLRVRPVRVALPFKTNFLKGYEHEQRQRRRGISWTRFEDRAADPDSAGEAARGAGRTARRRANQGKHQGTLGVGDA